MSIPRDWERVRTLFHAALDQPPELRDAFLSDACDGDDDLRRRMRSLIAAHAEAGGFLETPVVRFNGAPPGSAVPTLQAGDRLGRFEVVGLLGAGGMGEVYRARDSRLGREVAIKILPHAFAADPQRLARFEGESRVLASLSHPNIAVIHDIEHVEGLCVLILELVEGPTLAERVNEGPVPLREALAIARQLADALATAHARGIVHRDLKPANVKLASSGHVTLLDFGLAKAREDDAEAGVVVHQVETTAGLILGTCAYMSPEQARGQPVDRRTDIWAFGCILYELLAGRSAFGRDTPSETIAAVLERQPDWPALPDRLPEPIHRLLRRCLEKDPDGRLHDIADARLEIDDAQRGIASSGLKHGVRRSRISGRFATLVVLMAGAVTLGWLSRALVTPTRLSPPRLTRFTWSLPAGLGLTSAPAISPDGRSLAFTASQIGALSRLYVRRLSEADAHGIPGTEASRQPFWAPDGKSLGYFARGRLMKVAVAGGAPVDICSADGSHGGAWGSNGTIIFSSELAGGLSSVSATGGTPVPATLLDTSRDENSHRWPKFLPDGRHFVYFVRSLQAERRGVYLGRLDGPAARPGAPIFRSESEALVAPLDDDDLAALVSVADAHVDIRRFDTRTVALASDPVRLPLLAAGNTPHHPAMLSVSADTLAYVGAVLPYGSRLASVLRTGQELRLDTAPAASIDWPRASPDGSRLAIHRLDSLTGSGDVWVKDLARGTWVRVSREGSSALLPVWSPDSTRLTYVTGGVRSPRVTIAAADGTRELATVLCPTFMCEPTDWSRDGRWILVNALDERMRSSDVWMLPARPGDRPRPLLTGPFVERDARLSPDGHFIAYVSDEVGHPEISIRTMGAGPQREVVSVGGGSQPVWTRDGRELLFVDREGMLRAVAVRRVTNGRPVVGNPARVAVPPLGVMHYSTQYDISVDGRRIYFLDRQPRDPLRDISVIVGWRELIN